MFGLKSFDISASMKLFRASGLLSYLILAVALKSFSHSGASKTNTVVDNPATLLGGKGGNEIDESSSSGSAALSSTSHSYSKIAQSSGETAQGRSNASILVSYVLYAPKGLSEHEWCRQCLENTNIFIERAVIEDPRVTFLFSLIGADTEPTKTLRTAVMQHTNVQVRTQGMSKETSTDLYTQGTILSDALRQGYETFVLLNCGSRGPYYYSPTGEASILWLQKFTSKLGGDVKAVGATVSCEVAPHVQSYAMAIDADAARLLYPLWTNTTVMTQGSNLAIIYDAEVGASSLLLAKGYNIAAHDSRLPERDFRIISKGAALCDPYYSCPNDARHLNPVACWPKGDVNSPGCLGVEPCDVMFVKTGGTIVRLHLFPTDTTGVRMKAEDRTMENKTRPYMCTHVPKYSSQHRRKRQCKKKRRRKGSTLYRVVTSLGIAAVGLILFGVLAWQFRPFRAILRRLVSRKYWGKLGSSASNN